MPILHYVKYRKTTTATTSILELHITAQNCLMVDKALLWKVAVDIGRLFHRGIVQGKKENLCAYVTWSHQDILQTSNDIVLGELHFICLPSSIVMAPILVKLYGWDRKYPYPFLAQQRTEIPALSKASFNDKELDSPPHYNSDSEGK